MATETTIGDACAICLAPGPSSPGDVPRGRAEVLSRRPGDTQCRVFTRGEYRLHPGGRRWQDQRRPEETEEGDGIPAARRSLPNEDKESNRRGGGPASVSGRPSG
ncbi:hypothetical protein SKAU_G00271860 [Synaphobranchus kaupii]|uniref:Uncharacterized protein n=1 Tax=Synaphobranchus kaupii TaxID=118154 RepID=A0A9Q1F0F3_SYNKA|nr:hypothetical protein SKAU_G00271860 [Synaphobranchus kaupii]